MILMCKYSNEMMTSVKAIEHSYVHIDYVIRLIMAIVYGLKA